MPLEADTIVAKRKLRGRVSFWRTLALVLAGVTLVALTWAAGSKGGFSFGKSVDHVARIRVEGLITGDTNTLKMLKDIETAKQVKALIVLIDSPGGTTAGSEAIYERLRLIAKDRPVVAVMGTVAASGGYITAIGADHIVARGNTITGSIGVIFQWAQVKDLLDTLGIQFRERKSGELKAEPNMFNEPTEKTLAVTDAMIRDSFNWFTGLVKERRGLDAQQMALVSDGRVFTGRQAIAAKLVDSIGGEEEARDWLQKQHSIETSLKTVDWKPEADVGSNRLGLFGLRMIAQTLGFGGTFEQAADQIVRLDGLLALWHPELR